MSPISKKRKLLGDIEGKDTVSPHESANTPVSADTPSSANAPAANTEKRRSLFVRSLAKSITTERLAEYFSEKFPIKHATVVVDSVSKESRGFGFVTFTDADDAQAAAAEFNNSVLDGRKIKVEVAESRQRDTGEEGARSRNTVNTKAAELRANREKVQAENRPPKLIVRNLPWSIKNSDDLSKLFLSYGKVKLAVVPQRGPKAQAGFGFVILRGRKNAEKALAGVNGKEVDGRTLAVDWAVDKDTWEELQKEQTGTDDKAEVEHAPSSNEDAKKLRPETEDEATSEVEELDGVDEDESVDSDEGSGMDIDDDEVREGEEVDKDLDLDASPPRPRSNDTTVFVRNLPFSTDDDILKEHFTTFGPVRYARVVYDPETERSRGTAFVAFYNEEDAKACVVGAPKPLSSVVPGNDKKRNATHTLLQDDASDPSGKYTLDGRVLQVSRALNRDDANKRMEEGKAYREKNDKRRLYLLKEGTVANGTKLYEQLGKAENDIRESSAKQRQKQIKDNPNMGLSLTRLSIRNIPRTIDSKALKALAREAVVGFASDVKAGKRAALNKEEITRGGAEMIEAEKRRKAKGVGMVKQAKIVYEGREGGKVKGDEGGGRSRGYGFLEYTNHRWALMGLRWLNGHFVKSGGEEKEKGKRLIVEFALEDARVVARRSDKERKFKEGGKDGGRARNDKEQAGVPKERRTDWNQSTKGKKRKRAEDDGEAGDKNGAAGAGKKQKKAKANAASSTVDTQPADADDKAKVEQRNRIIGRKRQKRKTRKG